MKNSSANGEFKKRIARDKFTIFVEDYIILEEAVSRMVDEAKKEYWNIKPKSDSPIEIGYLRAKWFMKWFGES